MSTRGCIARLIDRERGQFKGVFHHWDSHPSGLGKTLFELRKTSFNGSTKDMLKVLIDDHPAGWSTIINADWNLSPGFFNKENYPGEGHLPSTRPQCLCHGDLLRPPEEMTEMNLHEHCFIEYVYTFSEDNSMMQIISFWHGIAKAKSTDNTCWIEVGLLAEIDLNGDEPSWKALDELPPI